MHRLVDVALANRFFVMLAVVVLIVVGSYALKELPIDAVPDITPNQVIVLTQSPSLAPEEVERFLTFPVEMAMSGLPGVTNIFSISRYGISYVAVYFRDDMDVFFCRQLVMERLSRARELIPAGLGAPELAPVTTGLGEIYHFKVTGDGYSLMELRSLLDWEVAPKLRTVPGIVDVNTHGGDLKTYEVQLDKERLLAYKIPLSTVLRALEENNANAGGAYLIRSEQQSLIRGEGLIKDLGDIERIVIGASDTGAPVYIRNVAQARFAPMVKQGFATQDGNGEITLGVTMMLIRENSRVVVDRVKERIAEIQKGLPPGVRIEPFYDRTNLVRRTIVTVATNLIEGAVLVIAVLVILLGNLTGSLIVSLAIPLSMLVAFIGMKQLGVSGNLMSLGAIDFGLIVDGSVFMVEAIIRRLAHLQPGRSAIAEIRAAGADVTRPIVFGVLIIILVYVPILTLGGVEGKMLRPMAITVMLAIGASLIIALTVTPVLCSFAFRKGASEKETWLMKRLSTAYSPALRTAIRFPKVTVGVPIAIFVTSLGVTPFLGAEFLPKLDEGSILILVNRTPGISITESVEANTAVEKILKRFPEVDTVVSRTGRAEVALDPAGMEMTDVYVMLKPSKEWPASQTKPALITALKAVLEKEAPGATYTFSQPIEMRMQELMEAGLRSDIAVKVYGDDLTILREKAQQIEAVLSTIPGTADLRAERTAGLPYLRVRIQREEIARYGINASDVLDAIESIGGKQVGQIVEGERRYALQVRLAPHNRDNIDSIKNMKVAANNGRFVPLGQLAEIFEEDGPNQISRERIKRRVSVEVNVRGRDIAGFVAEAQRAIEAKVQLPPGYSTEWGGQFKQLEGAVQRLSIAVPLTLLLIFILLYFNCNSARLALLIYLNIPLAATGGIFALLLRGLPFSVSAGVGFICLFGIAVLNGVVLVSYISKLREEGLSVMDAVTQGARTQLRPVVMTALVASLGFIPMALASGSGAEVQRPLATVVIGGMIPSTFLTVLVIPTIYAWMFRKEEQTAA